MVRLLTIIRRNSSKRGMCKLSEVLDQILPWHNIERGVDLGARVTCIQMRVGILGRKKKPIQLITTPRMV